jgi:predicted small metal-binding protein
MVQKKVTCDCGKTLSAGSDDQLVADVQKHANDIHNMKLTRDQVLAMAQPT